MSQVFEITNADQHDAFIINNDKCIIFFGSARCPHCQTMVPIIDKMASSYPKIKFSHVETTKVKTEGINGVPAFVGYKSRQAVDVVLGADPDAITAMIKNYLS